MRSSGPAFPILITQTDTHPDETTGMKLRDYFAAAVLTGITSGTDEMGMCSWTTDAAVHLAYKVADAMLEERDK